MHLGAIAVEFGLPAALWVASQRSGAFEALRSVRPLARQGSPSLAHYVLLAAIRCVGRTDSMTEIAARYGSSVLQRLWKFPSECFTSRAIWGRFDTIEVSCEGDGRPASDDLQRCQAALWVAFRSRQLVGERVLVYDTTNSHTWVASPNGHSNQKRNDLRQAGISYVLDGGCGLALCHHLYRGGLADGGDLPAALECIGRILDGASISRDSVTLASGKDSAALRNTLELQRHGLGWVSELPWNEVPEQLRGRGPDGAEEIGAGVRATGETA